MNVTILLADVTNIMS